MDQSGALVDQAAADNTFLETVSTKLEPIFSILGPHPILQALAIVIVFWLLSRLVDKLLCGLVAKWVMRSKNTLDDSLVGILHRPVRITVLLIGLGVATIWLGLSEKLLFATLATLKTIAIFVWLVFLMRFTTMVLHYLSSQQGRFHVVQSQTVPLLKNLAIIVILAVAIYAVLLAWGINVTAWLASAGIVGLALSFAAKDTLANLFAGMSILADHPYKVGDFIMLESGERGQVTHIGMRSTRLLTRDDIEVTIPNGLIGNDKIVNESSGPYEKHRVRVKVSVAYGSDIDQVREILMAIADGRDDICEQPEPRVRFRRFGDSGLEFELLAWIEKPVLRGRILDALHQRVYKDFNDAGIEIPYAKQDVYVKEMPKRRGNQSTEEN